jgi:hypothetical protein
VIIKCSANSLVRQHRCFIILELFYTSRQFLLHQITFFTLLCGRSTRYFILSSRSLSFSIANVDELFPGFAVGDFAVLYGTRAFLPLFLLRVR